MRVVLIILGAVLVLDSLFAAGVSNFNMGVLMPALLGMPLLLCGVFYNFVTAIMANGAGRVVKFALIGAYALFAVSFIWVSVLMFSAAQEEPAPGADAVIMLGAALHGDQVSRVLAWRLDKAVEYLQANPDTVCVVTGGQGAQETCSEALAMARYLIDHGIESSRIVLEENATSTNENFAYSIKLLDDLFGQGNHRDIFVTSGFHVFRAKRIAKKQGRNMQGLSSGNIWYLLPNHVLREYLAIIQYAVLGDI